MDGYPLWISLPFCNYSPVKDEIVVNNRWGANGTGPSGDYKSFENVRDIIYRQNYKWENAVPLDPKSWGYRREAQLSEYLQTSDLLRLVVQAVR